MKTTKRMVAAIAAAAMIGGCSSTGDGSGATATYADGTTREITLEEFLACLFSAGLACPPADDGSSSQSQTQTQTYQAPQRATLSSWSELSAARGGRTDASSLATAMGYRRSADQDVVPDWIVTSTPEQWSSVGVTEDGLPVPISVGGYGLPTRVQYAVYSQPREDLGAAGQPDLVAVRGPEVAAAEASPFVSSFARHVVVLADAPALGWDYQSFGAWNGIGDQADGMVATTFGAATPASAVPAAGAATFTGRLAGLYVSSAGQGSLAAANLSVQADFSSRSLTLKSDSTFTSRDLAAGAPAPQLNLSGTLTYAPGSSVFSGTLANAGGTMSGSSNGRFYGPAAQELGGTFALRSGTTPESFVGAYGARR